MSAPTFELDGFSSHSDGRTVRVQVDHALWGKFDGAGILTDHCSDSMIDVAMSIGAGKEHTLDVVVLSSETMSLYDALGAIKFSVDQALAGYDEGGTR